MAPAPAPHKGCPPTSRKGHGRIQATNYDGPRSITEEVTIPVAASFTMLDREVWPYRVEFGFCYGLNWTLRKLKGVSKIGVRGWLSVKATET